MSGEASRADEADTGSAALPGVPTRFRLSEGGLLHALLVRLRLASRGEDPNGDRTWRRVVALAAVAWVPLAVLSVVPGVLDGTPVAHAFLHDFVPHVRYLVTLPLLVIADALVDPALAAIIRSVGSSRIIPEEANPGFQAALEALARGRDSRLADVVVLGLAVLGAAHHLGALGPVSLPYPERSWELAQTAAGIRVTAAGWWSALVSVPLLQLLLLRWLWRSWLWAVFLRQVSRIPLRLEPSHPDLVGGLGILPSGQGALVFVWVAYGATFAATLAQEIVAGKLTLTGVGPYALGYVAASLVVNAWPLLFFTGRLIDAQRRGRMIYGALGYQLVRAFDDRWHGVDGGNLGKKLLTSNDSSAIADFTALFANVRAMRRAPLDPGEFVVQAVLLALPFGLLVLTEVPFADVLKRLLDSLL